MADITRHTHMSFLKVLNRMDCNPNSVLSFCSNGEEEAE